MAKRFVSIWFRHLTTDWFTIKHPELSKVPFVLASPVRGRKVITAANALAETQGIGAGMVVADARALMPGLQVLDDIPGVGFMRWRVELLKVRNGKTGSWEIEWNEGSFHIIELEKQTIWLNVSSQYGSAI